MPKSLIERVTELEQDITELKAKNQQLIEQMAEKTQVLNNLLVLITNYISKNGGE